MKKNIFYSAVWCATDENSLKKAVPFEALAQSLKKYSQNSIIKLVVLEGYDRLSDTFLNHLNTLGFEIIDYTTEFSALLDRFPNICQHYNQYERNCFLRWISFKEVTKKDEAIGQFWHLDCDVVLYTSLDDLAEGTKGKTFMLEGCPVFVSISNKNWFEVYAQELNKLEHDIDGYSLKAIAEKEICRKKDSGLCNQSLFRNPLGSDQDFLEYLVSAEIIPQEKSEVVFQSPFCWVQNPLQFSLWDNYQKFKEKPGKVEYRNEEIIYGGKAIPFIHYQNTFCNFANILLILNKFRLLNFAFVRKAVNFEIEETKFRITWLATLISKIVAIMGLRYDREDIIELLAKKDCQGQPILIKVLNFINEKDKPKI